MKLFRVLCSTRAAAGQPDAEGFACLVTRPVRTENTRLGEMGVAEGEMGVEIVGLI